MKMKKSVTDFLKANGFYLSFGVGIVALVAALAVYNVNTNKKEQQQNQEINLNEPVEQEMADAEEMEDIQETILDGDMDVPMDMWMIENNTEEKADTTLSSEESGEVAAEDAETEDTEPVISNEAKAYEPLGGLTFTGMEEVSMPVLGNTILPYSMDTTVYFQTLGTYRCNPGMLLQAPVGTEVTSIWHGQVIGIADTKEYGTTVTVDLGSGYTAVYGQLQEIGVTIGDEVWKDTILGTVAEPTAYYEKEGSHLFFAIEKDGQPVNPMEILQVE